ncbi:hypothetical protein BDW02DRAFT_571365, partial [Decorospora gaudefroyi]
MARQPAVVNMIVLEPESKESGFIEMLGLEPHARPAVIHSQSEPTFTKNKHPKPDVVGDDVSSGESRDIVEDATLPTLPRPLLTQVFERRQSCSTVADSPRQSRSSSPKASLGSSVTSPSIYTVDSSTCYNAANGLRRPSTISRLKSSMGTGSSTKQPQHRPVVHPDDFQTIPEQPEKRFVDGIGMVFPGVCDRPQCAHPHAHFVSSFRLCEPIEYTTALADHGITYTDYSRLVTALMNFLEEANVSKRRRSNAGSANSQAPAALVFGEDQAVEMSIRARTRHTLFDTTEQLKRNKRQAAELNKLLEDITWNLQERGLSVMVSVHSFSVFAPARISEAHIQILHVSRDQSLHSLEATGDMDARMEQRLSFIDIFSLTRSEQRPPRPRLERRAVSTMTTRANESTYHHQQSQVRDRSKPCALWPNAIPSRKRQIMNANVDRYGIDPYFRAWMRANINSRTRSSTYAKYLIEQEDNPFVNKRLEYTDAASRRNLVDVLLHGSIAWKKQFPSTVNRAKYEHNRRLECRKTTEHSSRLRVLRFAFRHPIYPPHTPEMAALGLSRDAYHSIITDIDNIHTRVQMSTRCPGSYIIASLNKVRRRSTEDALKRVSEYLRQLTASQRRIVWTIEKIPDVYDKGFARNRTEWEISAWNAEDPLELLIQLEKWGIIEKRLSLDDD